MVKDPKEIPWELIVPELVKAATPFIQAITWIGLSKVDPKINALNNLIAIAEIVPTIDLGLPKGIVLGAMYDKTGDALVMLNKIAQAVGDLPGDLKEFIQEKVDETKEEAEEKIEEVIPGTQEQRDLVKDILNLFRPATWDDEEGLHKYFKRD
tara:strand:+ start:175 stop:633 length:459 start_codon:yes stop_codon:yes gene_type:complete